MKFKIPYLTRLLEIKEKQLKLEQLKLTELRLHTEYLWAIMKFVGKKK